MTEGTSFQPVLDDTGVANPDLVDRVVLMTGKLYYDLVKERAARSVSNVAFIRLEEIAPFPFAAVREVLERYPNASEYVWLQEEPKNQGAYEHVARRIGSVLPDGATLEYRGRKESAIPAPGIGKLYASQQKAVIESAFTA
jgi:probable 2-oxoglutarate dehydrogenase E1 component DHKTD1